MDGTDYRYFVRNDWFDSDTCPKGWVLKVSNILYSLIPPITMGSTEKGYFKLSLWLKALFAKSPTNTTWVAQSRDTSIYAKK
jgi:hypothetical protein